MTKKTILLTWGLGYIGSHTAVELYDAGYQCVIVDNLSNTSIDVLWNLEQLVWTQIPFCQWDIRDKGFLTNIFSRYQIDAVIHFAAKKAVGESMEQPFEYYDNNVQGSTILTQVMLEYGVRNLIFSGTCAIYSPHATAPYDEKAPIWPESVYAITKRMTEEMLDGLYKSQWLSSIILRYFNPIWNHDSALIGEIPRWVPQNLMPYLMQVINGTREYLSVYGDDYDTPDGTCIRDYIHVVDLAQAHVKALDYLLKQEWPMYDTINIGTGKGVSVLEMICAVEKVIDKQFPYRIVDRRLWDLPVVYGNVDKARHILSRQAQRSLEDGIRDMLNFYMK